MAEVTTKNFVAKIDDLLPSEENPRSIGRKEYEALKKSLVEFPEMKQLREIIIDEDNNILAGHQRIYALKDLGYEDVFVRQVHGLTKKQKREFMVKDNVSSGKWDADIIANQWDVEELENWGVPKFELGLIEPGPEAKEDDFDTTPPSEPQTVLGDLYEIGEHRLLCGDSTDSDSVARLMNGQKADMVFTDPPYGMKLDTDYSKMPSTKKEGNKIYDKIKGDNDDFSNELINTIFACFNDCKEIFIWGADYFAELLPNKNEGSWVVWDKRVDENFDKMIGSAFELCWSKSKHQRKIARINNTLFSGEQDAKNKLHPTQKPIKLVTFFFDNWGKKNDLVADLYLGSGSTMVASHQLNRKCYGMELDPKYCDVIITRMLKLDPSLIIKRNGEVIEWQTVAIGED